MKVRQYELVSFYFSGLGTTNALEVPENERVVAVLKDIQPTATEDRREILCLVERLVDVKEDEG